MRRIRFTALMIAAAGTLLMSTGQAKESEELVPRISPKEVKARLGSPEIIVIDVRQPSDWNRSLMKIAGAHREDPRLTGSWMERYPKEKTIVLYCS